MEGPTPVSALIHAATLVTAGVFLIIRCSFIFEHSSTSLLIVSVMGALTAFFAWHPWLFLILMPAIGMRLWAEERRSGTIELLMTLPVTNSQLVIGKFFASWVFTLIALLLSTPIWITVNYLGNPDNSVIFISYLTSWLMAGAFLALTSCLSTLTKNQVIAFFGEAVQLSGQKVD